MAAMILLGINCGMGNTDCAQLFPRHIDWASGWLHYSRPKTGVERRAKLWPETMAALPTIKWEDSSKPLFTTKYGHTWDGTPTSNPISAEFKKLLDQLNLYAEGRTFYSLRRTFGIQLNLCLAGAFSWWRCDQQTEEAGSVSARQDYRGKSGPVELVSRQEFNSQQPRSIWREADF